MDDFISRHYGRIDYPPSAWRSVKDAAGITAVIGGFVVLFAMYPLILLYEFFRPPADPPE